MLTKVMNHHELLNQRDACESGRSNAEEHNGPGGWRSSDLCASFEKREIAIGRSEDLFQEVCNFGHSQSVPGRYGVGDVKELMRPHARSSR